MLGNHIDSADRTGENRPALLWFCSGRPSSLCTRSVCQSEGIQDRCQTGNINKAPASAPPETEKTASILLRCGENIRCSGRVQMFWTGPDVLCASSLEGSEPGLFIRVSAEPSKPRLRTENTAPLRNALKGRACNSHEAGGDTELNVGQKRVHRPKNVSSNLKVK